MDISDISGPAVFIITCNVVIGVSAIAVTIYATLFRHFGSNQL